MFLTSSRSELVAAATALQGLALLLATGCGFREALARWPEVAETNRASILMDVARSVRLGASIADVAGRLAGDGAFGSSLARPLRAAARVDRYGSDAAAALLEASAQAIRTRATRAGAVEAATAGARLSGWLVAGLPLAFVLLVPMAVGAGIDAVDVVLFAIGAAWILVGIRWLARCNPVPPRDAPVMVALVEIAALVRAGMPLWETLDIVARATSWAALSSAATDHRLGVPWPEALCRVGDRDAHRLASICRTAHGTGCNAAPALDRMNAEVLEREEQAFEKKVRRAPVVMVLPLVLCILPGFATMTLGPFLRQLVS